MKVIFATHNPHKVKELNSIIAGSKINFVSLTEIGWLDEIEENGSTIEENAWIKAETVYRVKQMPVMSEDTGLIIDSLGGDPGVHTARYAGPLKNADQNMDKVLQLMLNENNRTARFKTVIALIIDGSKHQFTGICEGAIARSRKGDGGFGYDPIFVPQGYDLSFGQLADEIKDEISHRAKAVKQLLDFLER